MTLRSQSVEMIHATNRCDGDYQLVKFSVVVVVVVVVDVSFTPRYGTTFRDQVKYAGAPRPRGFTKMAA